MQSAIVVGQDKLNNCLVATFNGETEVWSVDTSFPTINGVLFGVYSVNQSDVWVCGGTGNDGKTSPILYHYVGRSTWVDHSADITDANFLFQIDGNATNYIWAGGRYSGADQNAIWHYDGTWDSTYNALVGSPSTGCGRVALAVSSEGHLYVAPVNNGLDRQYQYIYSDIGGSLAIWRNHGSTLCHDISAPTDSCIAYCVDNGGRPVYYYDGSWHNVGVLGGSYSGISAVSASDFIWYNHSYNTIRNQSNVNYGDPGPMIDGLNSQIPIHYSRDDEGNQEIWVCQSRIPTSGRWFTANTAPLTYWEGGTTWSGTTDYNVNGLNAAGWFDITKNMNPPPYLISGPTSPNPGYYIDTPMTWKLGQD